MTVTSPPRAASTAMRAEGQWALSKWHQGRMRLSLHSRTPWKHMVVPQHPTQLPSHRPRMAEGGMPKVTPSPCPGTGAEACASRGRERLDGLGRLPAAAVVSKSQRRRRWPAAAPRAACNPPCGSGRCSSRASCCEGPGQRPRRRAPLLALTEPPVWPLTSLTAVACFTMAMWAEEVCGGQGGMHCWRRKPPPPYHRRHRAGAALHAVVEPSTSVLLTFGMIWSPGQKLRYSRRH